MPVYSRESRSKILSNRSGSGSHAALGISDVINGCIQAGCRIEKREEYPHSNRETDYDIYEHQPVQLPMCFILTARKAS